VTASPLPNAQDRERAQDLLRRLAVFVDGFTLEAAQAVADGPIETPGSALWGQAPDHLPPGRPSAALVGALQDLAHRKLLHREEGQTGSPRYRLPEAVRAGALAHLAATGELAAARRAHAAYFLGLTEAVDRRVWTAELPHWMARLEADWENLRAALAWAEAAGNDDLFPRLATALWLFWQTRGRVAEGRDWLGRALARGGWAPRVRAAGLTVAGTLAWLQDDFAPAAAMLDEAADRWRDLAFPQGLGRALFARALVAWRGGDEVGMVALVEEALGLFRAANDLAGQPLCLIEQAVVARRAGGHKRALALLEEAIGLAEYGAFAWGMAVVRYCEGEIRTDWGDYGGAAEAYRASIATAWALGDPWTTGAGIGGLATVAALRGAAGAAARLFGAADALCRGAGAFLPVVDRAVYEHVVAAARATLGGEVFAAAFDAGAALTPGAAIAEATAVARGDPMTTVGGPDAESENAAATAVRPTPRELDVLRLLVEGRQDADVARTLGLSAHTVSQHVGNMLKKSGCPTRTALAVFAVRSGYV
jgi:DNA-binding CsgD family transcriptional regulator/tetratricopeptide (TPR) repeat protein